MNGWVRESKWRASIVEKYTRAAQKKNHCNQCISCVRASNAFWCAIDGKIHFFDRKNRSNLNRSLALIWAISTALDIIDVDDDDCDGDVDDHELHKSVHTKSVMPDKRNHPIIARVELCSTTNEAYK